MKKEILDILNLEEPTTTEEKHQFGVIISFEDRLNYDNMGNPKYVIRTLRAIKHHLEDDIDKKIMEIKLLK